MLTCHNLTCTRGANPVFTELGFTVGAQTAVVVVGPNGSGKTSLLRIIAGLIPPTTGEVQWFGEPIHKIYGEYCCDMAYLGHNNAIKPELTVEDNLLLWSKLRHTEIMLEAALHYFHLSDKRHLPCHMLSAGWQRRVALARLMVCNARLWLLDEPLANLDEEGRRLVINLINSRISQGGMVVISSHTSLAVLNSACEIDIGDFAPAYQMSTA